MGHKVLQAMSPGQVLIYQGEGFGGCTADDAFHEELENSGLWAAAPKVTQDLAENHLQFAGIHDRWTVWMKL